MGETRYRPANQTEADDFMDRFCERCAHYNDCTIRDDAFWLDVDDSNYPKEWTVDSAGPLCTAYEPLEARHA